MSTEPLETRRGERVYIVDDDAAVLRSVSRLLRSAGLEPVGYGSAEAFLRDLDPEAGGCVVLDLSMPGLDGLALQRELSARGSALPVVFVSGHADVPKSVSAMKEGAVDFLTKPVKGDILLAAVERALGRGREAREDRRAVDDLRRRIASLSQREREVMEGVVAGMLNKQIAGELGIAEQTVKVHRARVMEKMAAPSVADLVRMADRAGIRRA
jgi:FixJ family two-component response regulator